MRIISRIPAAAAIAGLALLVSGCGGTQTTQTVANTTEVTPADTGTAATSDAMVTNIDAAVPTGADANSSEPIADNSSGNAL